MKKYFKNVIALITLVLLVITFINPTPSIATTDFGFGNSNLFDNTTFGSTFSGGGATSESSNNTVTKCNITAGSDFVNYGGSITLSWDTAGFSNLKINGESVSGNVGEKTFHNIFEDTTFTLTGVSADGQSNCVANVSITCLPPEVPKECELVVEKSVNKTNAKPGEELTYTIKVKNSGDADCTGGGVMIKDVLDPNITYLRHTVSNNLTAGYMGTPVYTAHDRTLHFNGNTLTPNESGTITWVGQVNKPEQCGDFKIKNQAKVTAAELDHFSTWVYSQIVETEIDYDCPPPPPQQCVLTVNKKVNKTTAMPNDKLTYTIEVKNIGDIDCTGSGVLIEDVLDTNLIYVSHSVSDNMAGGYLEKPVYTSADRTLRFNGFVLTPNESGTITWVGQVKKPEQCGDFVINNQARATAFELNNFNDWVYSSVIKTDIKNECVVPKVPECTLTPTEQTVTLGNKANLTWTTKYANEVTLAGEKVELNGSREVGPINVDGTYILVAKGEGGEVSCQAKVKVGIPAPICETFTATPNPVTKGENIVLNWKTVNATKVSIDNGIGEKEVNSSWIVSPVVNTTYIMTVYGTNNQSVTCEVPVVVKEPEAPFTCVNNVVFTTTNSSIRRGASSVLNWSTTNVDTVAISGISATGLAGSQSVSPTNNTTYVLTAKQGDKTINCPLTINVTTSGGGGGGGGGSASPRCELTVSDKKIKSGEQITLSWDTSSANSVTITDQTGEVLMTTDDYLASQKSDYYSGTMKLKPTRDTRYTLVAERGTRDVECKVLVEVEDDVVIIQTRDQQPLITSIALSQVPYTGFEAGPIMTALFYLVLIAWSLYIAYVMVIKKQMISDANVAGEELSAYSQANREAMKRAEAIRPDLFVPKIIKQPYATAPHNLPTGNLVTSTNESAMNTVTSTTVVTDEVVTALENHAHSKKALLSSDAVRYFMATTNEANDRQALLDIVINDAKKHYPVEDGWIVINESRMRNLCDQCQLNDVVSQVLPPQPPVVIPEGSGSLAEAIVTGNIVAAYAMIGHRPMFALADAAADLDSVYRHRRGEKQIISDMLLSETEKLSDTQIKDMITALTSALDGTYNDEVSAVKMAIMKAVKVVA